MARTKEMAFKKNNPRSNIWHWSEETSTTTYRNQYRNCSEECHCWYRNWNWHSSKTATDRWHTTSRSFRKMRRSEDDPTDLYTLWIRFSKYLNNIFFHKAKNQKSSKKYKNRCIIILKSIRNQYIIEKRFIIYILLSR